MIYELRHKYPITNLLTLVNLPKSTYYYHLKRQDEPDKYQQIKAIILEIFHQHKGCYGYRRITLELHNRGFHINHKTAQKLMKEQGLCCRIRKKKYRSYQGEVGNIAPNLLNRDFHADGPNQKWVTDITQFSLLGQKVYLSPVMDLFNREIINYTISAKPSLQ